MVQQELAKRTRKKVEFVWVVTKVRLVVKSNIVRAEKKEKHIGSIN